MMLADQGAERAINAGIVAHGHDGYLEVCDLITPRTMTVESNELLYRCLEHIVSEDPLARVDLPRVLSAAHTLGLASRFEEAGELTYLRTVVNSSGFVRLESMKYLAGKIRKLEVARNLGSCLKEVNERLEAVTGEEPIYQILGLAEDPIFELTSLLASTGEEGLVPMGEGAEEMVVARMDNPVEMVGVSTGMPLFDRAIGGGLREGCFDIIGARQKTGKTLLADAVAVFIAKVCKVPVLNVDTEMAREDHVFRIAAAMSGLEIAKIEEGKYAKDPACREKLIAAAKELAGLPYTYLCAQGKPFEEVVGFMRRWVKRKVGIDERTGRAKPCVIVYDWLKLADASALKNNLAEYQLLGFVASGLKNFMAKYGARCLCFSQLNREGRTLEDTGAMRAADRVLDFCTSFSIFKRKDETELSEPTGDKLYTHKLVQVFSRYGKGRDRNDYIHVEADLDRATIKEGPGARELAIKLKKEFPSDVNQTEAIAVGGGGPEGQPGEGKADKRTGRPRGPKAPGAG